MGHSQDSDDLSSSKLAGESVASNLTSNSEERHEERMEDTRSVDEDPHTSHSSMDEFTSSRKEHENSDDLIVDPPSPTMRSDEVTIVDDGVSTMLVMLEVLTINVFLSHSKLKGVAAISLTNVLSCELV